MKTNPIQFAVVREDPLVEAELVARFEVKRALLVGSGGCTALELKTLFPDLAITLFDLNPHQLDLVERKVAALGHPIRFNIGDPSPSGLSQCGNFESLFRGFSGFLREMVVDEADLHRLLTSREGEEACLESIFANSYWPVAFELYFSEALLAAMFGRNAITHAPPGSYPRYFQAALERGLRSGERTRNYFLHHIFLGCYLPGLESLPRFLTRPASPSHYRFDLVNGPVEAVRELGSFDLIALSNIFDWMPTPEVQRTARLVVEKSKPGTVVIFRQLNHASQFERFFEPAFRFDGALAGHLYEKDRSLFYSRLCVGVRGETYR